MPKPSKLAMIYEDYPCIQNPEDKLWFHWHWFSEKLEG